MRIDDLAGALDYAAIEMPEPEACIRDGYTSDLLSDVMGNACEGSVLITIQGHKNTVAVASLVGIKAVVLCNGRKAPDDMREAARREKVAILGTADSQFTASYRIARLLDKR